MEDAASSTRATIACAGLAREGVAGAAGGFMNPVPNAVAGLIEALRAGTVRLIDLTHGLDEHSPYWPEGRDQSSFSAKVASTYESHECFARDVTMSEHSGTHLDAPGHVIPGGATVDQLPVSGFLNPACVVDVRDAVATDPDYRVTVVDLEGFIEANGPLPRGCFVFFHTGWASRWPSQKQFINEDAEGVKHFPGISLEAARFLLAEVHPVGVGIDTLSIEYGRTEHLAVHRFVLGAGLYILENVANLELLPATGALVIALPLKLLGGSGSPARVLAWVPNQP